MEPNGTMITKTTILAITLAGALAATGAMAQTKKGDKDSQKFITAAIQGDIAEVGVGKLAQEKSQSEAVKKNGAMLGEDRGDPKTKEGADAEEPRGAMATGA